MVSELLSGWLLPMIYAVGLLLTTVAGAHHWRVAQTTMLVGFLSMMATVLVSVTLMLNGFAGVDRLGLIMAMLVALLGWIIVSYSRRYLHGEPGQGRFVQAMMLTLFSVSVLVVTGHLLIMALAWTGSGLGLHRLLTFYQERRTAQIVAHKRFLVSRLAELCLFTALLLVYSASGTLYLPELSTWIAGQGALPVSMHVAAVLVALSAILMSAQLPLHGWLIQVMEAPTPVSALLHAGVINMGGFVLIRLADLIGAVPAAQGLLVLVGSITAVLAGLVMMTRISIKVRLAWSTCAQMGFMLMEIGLGLYALALLHLVAHSLYKAFAFLEAGESVQTIRRRQAVGISTPQPLWYIAAPLISLGIVSGSLWLWSALGATVTLPPDAALIISFGMAALLWFEAGAATVARFRALLQVTGLIQLYLFWHLLFTGLTPAAQHAAWPILMWVILSFTVLYGLQVWLRCFPSGRLSQRFYPWAYNGFYLDESFTRLAFRLWPARFSKHQARPTVLQIPIQYGESL